MADPKAFDLSVLVWQLLAIECCELWLAAVLRDEVIEWWLVFAHSLVVACALALPTSDRL